MSDNMQFPQFEQNDFKTNDGEETGLSDKQWIEMSQRNTLNINNLNKQIGLAFNQLGDHESRLGKLEHDFGVFKQNERLTLAQRSQLYNAVHDRVYRVLGISKHKEEWTKADYITNELYYQGVIRLLWSQAKKYSKVETTYSETKQVYFDDCMEYVNAWWPVWAGGLEGYLAYLDEKRETKKQLKAAS